MARRYVATRPTGDFTKHQRVLATSNTAYSTAHQVACSQPALISPLFPTSPCQRYTNLAREIAESQKPSSNSPLVTYCTASSRQSQRNDDCHVLILPYVSVYVCICMASTGNKFGVTMALGLGVYKSVIALAGV